MVYTGIKFWSSFNRQNTVSTDILDAQQFSHFFCLSNLQLSLGNTSCVFKLKEDKYLFINEW